MVRILLTASPFVNCLLLSPNFSGCCLHRLIVYLLPVGLGVRLFGAAFSMDRTLPIIWLCVNCLFVSPILIQRWAGSLGHCPSVSACSVRWASILRRVLYGCTVFRRASVRYPSAALFVRRFIRLSRSLPRLRVDSYLSGLLVRLGRVRLLLARRAAAGLLAIDARPLCLLRVMKSKEDRCPPTRARTRA